MSASDVGGGVARCIAGARSRLIQLPTGPRCNNSVPRRAGPACLSRVGRLRTAVPESAAPDGLGVDDVLTTQARNGNFGRYGPANGFLTFRAGRSAVFPAARAGMFVLGSFALARVLTRSSISSGSKQPCKGCGLFRVQPLGQQADERMVVSVRLVCGRQRRLERPALASFGISSGVN
jgi:hypothetical protein